jgi:peptidoglycan/xylan/chitin deacetylase (PgdA/CDA1 family)
MEEEPDLVERWAAAGLTFCNHSYSHAEEIPPEALVDEITVTESILQQIVPGATTRPFYRPPFGIHTEGTRQVAADLGYRTILWSLDPEDWRPDLDPVWLADYVVSNAQNGDIVLLHFTELHTVEALPAIIDGLRERGFSLEGLETLPEDQ